jgi:hypothetical protein
MLYRTAEQDHTPCYSDMHVISQKHFIVYRCASYITAHPAHSNRRIRICTPYQGHTIRYMDIHTTAGPHCTLYGYTHYSRATLCVIRIYTPHQGHIVRYTDIHTIAGPQCTLYGYTHYSRATLYVIRIYTLQQGHNICYTDFLTRSGTDTRYMIFTLYQGHTSILIQFQTKLLTDSYTQPMKHKVFTSVQIYIVFMWVTTPYKRTGGWTTNIYEGYEQSVAQTLNSVTKQLNPSRNSVSRCKEPLNWQKKIPAIYRPQRCNTHTTRDLSPSGLMQTTVCQLTHDHA